MYLCCCKSDRVEGERVGVSEMITKNETSHIIGSVREADAELATPASTLPPASTLLPENDLNMFYVSIDTLPEDGLGLDLDLLDDTGIMVNAVLGGAVHSWNKQADSGLQVRYGDRIVEVNGVRGNSQDHLDRLKEVESLQLWLKRPVAVRISGNAYFKSIGLVITYAPDGSTLLIQEVKKEGIVVDWNEDNPEFAVHEHDRIVEVNGAAGFATELMELLRSVDEVELLIFCYNI